MSIIKSITDSLPSEHMVAVSPAPETLPNPDQANPDASLGPDSTLGRRRLNLFTGRALSHQNLTLEQTHRDIHLNLLGQQLSAGVINGLMADLSNNPAIDTLSNPLAAQIVLTSGNGLTIHGEDLNLPSDQVVTLGNLPVYARPANLSGADTTLGNGDRPLEPRRLGNSLRSLITAGATLPTAGVVVLQPITTESSGAVPSTDPCAIDIDGLAFANLQRLDGVRLIFYAWPTEWLALPPLTALSTEPTPAEINRWRSHLAYSIFRRELAEPMPWNQLGVPIVLIGFDANWKALFSDRYAVVRQGGRALHRAIPVPNSGNPFLWQARLEQFAEQLSELDLSQIPPEQLDDYFAWLPPVGFLPANVIENLALPADGTPVTRRQLFFPTGYRVEIAPIPAEQLDLVFKESAPLLPYDTVSNDASSQVKLLVPVPEDLYEPDLLKLETIDPIFNTTLTRLINRRAEVLHRRQLVRSSTTHLNQAISGRPILFPTPDADQLEASEKSQPDAPFSSPRAHQSAIAQGLHEHGFTGATTTLSLQENSLLTTYVYLNAENPPTELMLSFQVGADSEHRAYWGGFTSQINRGVAGTASRQRIGELPALGAWTRLEVPVAAVGLTPNTVLTGMTFTLFNGRAAWGHTARLDTRPDGTGSEQLWVSTDLPAGASALSTNEPWLWLNAAERLTPFEERYGIEELAGDGDEGGFISAIAQLKTDLLATSPIDRDVVRVSFSGTDAENQQLTTLLNRIPASIPVSVTASTRTLSIQGILSAANRDQLLGLVGTDVAAVAAAYRQAVTDLFEQSQDNTALDSIEEKGLEDFILFIERLANEADDQIEFGFLRVRTDMFRIRQLVLDNEDASRLSVSPTLAAIAKQDTATATQKDLSDFFKRLKSEPVVAQPPATPATPSTASAAGATTTSATAASLPLINIVPRASSTVAFSLIEQPAVFNVLLTPTATASGPIRPASTSGAVTFNTTRFSTSAFLPQRTAEATISATNANLIKAQTQRSTPFITSQAAAVITDQSPLIGKVNQSITIAERLNAPPEPEARNYTLAGRVSVVNSLAGSVLFKDLSIPGDSNVTFGQIKRRPDSIVTDPGDLPQAPDKAAYFSSSVRVLDNTVAALRVAEGRIATYRKAISRSRSTLQVVEALRQQAQSRLNALSGDVANTRHDVSVTRALLAEEQQRLTGINQRREAILKTAVKALVFHRPRSLGPNPNAPLRSLNPGVTFPTRPNCLNQPHVLPDALTEATELLRQSPLNWFIHLPPLLNRFNKPEQIIGVLEQARLSALQPLILFKPALQRYANQPSPFAQAISRTVSTQQQVVSSYRASTAQISSQINSQINSQISSQINISALQTENWQRIRDRATVTLTLGDLIDGKHGQSQISRAAATEFEDLTRALGCLYTGFSNIRPVIRLIWAENLSQFDSPINLRNLSSLPRWAEVEYLQRRELQSVADWLYLRFSPSESAAIALINDLVRICLLIASAAPVDRIFSGRITAPTPAKTGGSVLVTIDPAHTRIGMKTIFYDSNNRAIATGIIEDLNQNRAVTRLMTTTQPTLQLTTSTQVRLFQTDRL